MNQSTNKNIYCCNLCSRKLFRQQLVPWYESKNINEKRVIDKLPLSNPWRFRQDSDQGQVSTPIGSESRPDTDPTSRLSHPFWTRIDHARWVRISNLGIKSDRKRHENIPESQEGYNWTNMKVVSKVLISYILNPFV